MDVLCAFCEEPVDLKSQGVLQRITGWERKRRQGGANQITLRQTLPEYAHAWCVDDRKHGIHQKQATIF